MFWTYMKVRAVAKLKPEGAMLLFLPKRQLLHALRHCRNDLGITECRLTYEDLDDLSSQLAVLLGDFFKTKEAPDHHEVEELLRRIKKNTQELARIIHVQEGLSDLGKVDWEARTRLLQWLSEHPKFHKERGGGNFEKLLRFTEELHNGLSVVCSAAEFAAEEVRWVQGKSGRPPDNWYVEFTRLLIDLCGRQGIKATLSVSERKPEHGGKKPYGGTLFKVATIFEMLLPVEMRTNSDSTRYYKLQKARAALK